MKLIIFLISIFISFNVVLAQSARYSQDALPAGYVSSTSSTKISSINLTGTFNELVIAIGFPDRNPTETYPRLYSSTTYPLLGAFPNGTLVNDYVNQQGGSIPIDQWF
ncbi:hypothetical protein [Rosettibacter firmus]|uniref:hypothetical protein n=1 Tax=Rosettibacter firmus TaxID=3111522 RepID=UPI00336C3048